MTDTAEKYFNIKGLAEYSSLGASTIRYHIKANGLPCFKLPGKTGQTGTILVKQSEFDAWLERYRSNDFINSEVVADDVIESLNLAESDR